MNCKCCNELCIKKGFQKNLKQKWYCNTCKLYQQSVYIYKMCSIDDEKMIIILNNNGVGIRGIARITGISPGNVINKIKQLAEKCFKPEIIEENQEYEVDEMQTYIQNKKKRCYITYAINKKTRQMINMVIGPRTKEMLGKVINSLVKLNPKKIFTDGLNLYPTLIKKEIHFVNPYRINHIERLNLSLRTHIKRLSRRTICFSKSICMLENCLRIYFCRTLIVK